MIGIIILNFNTWHETVQCVQSIQKNCTIPCKIYVVDNCSSIPVSQSELSYFNGISDVEIIYSNQNKGYSAGNNIGIRKALDDGCDSIVISNSDVIFCEYSIENMKEYISKNKNCGIVGPTIYNSDGKLQPFYMLCKLTGVGKLKNMALGTIIAPIFRKFKDKFIRDKELTTPLKVFGVSGCCYMMSRECSLFLYPFDERTFLYEEEYIIGARLENTYDVYIIPNSKVIHAHGKSTGGMSDFTYKCLIESEQLYLSEYVQCNVIIRKLILMIRNILRLKYVRNSDR